MGSKNCVPRHPTQVPKGSSSLEWEGFGICVLGLTQAWALLVLFCPPGIANALGLGLEMHSRGSHGREQLVIEGGAGVVSEAVFLTLCGGIEGPNKASVIIHLPQTSYCGYL